jgi:hypothetical protein
MHTSASARTHAHTPKLNYTLNLRVRSLGKVAAGAWAACSLLRVEGFGMMVEPLRPNV